MPATFRAKRPSDGFLNGVAFSPDGHLLAGGGKDGSVPREESSAPGQNPPALLRTGSS